MSVKTASVRNGGVRTVFLDFQLRSFFDFARSLASARSRSSVVKIRIFSPSLVKALLASIETTVGALRDPDKAKAVTVYPRDLFPTDARVYVAWMSPDVALLVHTSGFGRSVQTHLNFYPAGSSERMAS